MNRRTGKPVSARLRSPGFRTAALCIGFAFISGASSSTVGPLTEFRAGTTARATEVNANFRSVADAINDNAQRIEVLEVRSRVAVQCSNEATDSTLINAAIDGSPPGSEIVIYGRCLVDDEIVLRGNRLYRGSSNFGTVLRQADGANLPSILVSDRYVENSAFTGEPIIVRDLGIDGNRANNAAPTNGLVLRAFGSTVENLWITEVGGAGILLTNESRNGSLLSNSQVNGTIRNNTIDRVGDAGIRVVDGANAVTDWNLLDNWVGYSDGDGISLANTAGWTIERNHIYAVGGVALRAERVFATSISSNYIEDFGSGATSGVRRGLVLTVQGDAASTIVGNRIFNFTAVDGRSYEFISASLNYGVGVLTLSGNVLRAPLSGAGTHTGISLTGGAPNTLLLISSGNAVVGMDSNVVTSGGVNVSSGI